MILHIPVYGRLHLTACKEMESDKKRNILTARFYDENVYLGPYFTEAKAILKAGKLSGEGLEPVLRTLRQTKLSPLLSVS